MRFTPIQLTISVVLVASLLLSLLRFGGTSIRRGTASTTTTVTTIDHEELSADIEEESYDRDANHNSIAGHDRRPIKNNNYYASAAASAAASIHDDDDDDNNDNHRVLPYTVSPHVRPITRLIPSAADTLERRAQFGTLFRSPLSSGQVVRGMSSTDDDDTVANTGYDRVWYPALSDIEAARAALLIHEPTLSEDALHIAELQLATDMVLYRSWRLDCLAGAMERCHVIRSAIESLHQQLLGVLTSPLVQRLKCQHRHYTSQRAGVTVATRNAAREEWNERESEFAFTVALCGQGDLVSCQSLKRLLLSTSLNATREGTSDHAVTILCGNVANIQLLAARDMALNLAMSTRLEHRLRQLRDWIWARQMDDTWRDEQTAGFGRVSPDITLRSESAASKLKPIAATDVKAAEMKPINASAIVDDDDDEGDASLPDVLRNYRPKFSAAQELTHTKCHELIKTHDIQPFKGWGRAPAASQGEWKKWDCDRLLMMRPYNDDPEAIVASMKNQWSECVRMQAEYEIIPNVTWGLAASKVTWTWKRRNCDLFMWLKPPPPATDPFWESGVKTVAKNGTLPSVAICIATTTRNIPTVTKMMDLSLFLHTIPALAKTLPSNYEYHLYIGYDEADPYFDNPKHLKHVTDWFTLKVRQMLLSKHSIRIHLHLHSLVNPAHKPGVAFNAIIDIAYRDTAAKHQYFLRMPDDFQILRTWPLEMVTALQKQPYPHGVVGLSNKEGRTDRFPVEMIARSHLDIFSSYYPPSLSDWWMDDWLSHVWGSLRTTRITSFGVHRLFAHGTRFQVTHAHQALLQDELEQAKMKVIEWMKQQMYTPSSPVVADGAATAAAQVTPPAGVPLMTPVTIEAYSNDRFDFSVHADVANFDINKNGPSLKVVNHRVVSGDLPRVARPASTPRSALPTPQPPQQQQPQRGGIAVPVLPHVNIPPPPPPQAAPPRTTVYERVDQQQIASTPPPPSETSLFGAGPPVKHTQGGSTPSPVPTLTASEEASLAGEAIGYAASIAAAKAVALKAGVPLDSNGMLTTAPLSAAAATDPFTLASQPPPQPVQFFAPEDLPVIQSVVAIPPPPPPPPPPPSSAAAVHVPVEPPAVAPAVAPAPASAFPSPMNNKPAALGINRQHDEASI